MLAMRIFHTELVYGAASLSATLMHLGNSDLDLPPAY